MVAWRSTYLSDSPYTHNYWHYLSPRHLELVATFNGFQISERSDFTYLELGCGQGYSANLLASVHPDATFHGVDFNPVHIDNARALASQGGLKNIWFHEAAFEDVVSGKVGGLPGQFDFITLHGIYSWIGETNRAHVVTILESLLKPGGLIYVSYNALPGCATTIGLQRFVLEFARRQSASGPEVAPRAIKLAQLLREKKFAFFSAHEDIGARLDRDTKQSPLYLAHEYLNEDWCALHFADVADQLSRAGLTFVGSAALSHNDPATQLPRLLEGDDDDVVWAETLKDFARNTAFRSDIFQKDAKRLDDRDHMDALCRRKFRAMEPSDDLVKLASKGSRYGVDFWKTFEEREFTIADLARKAGLSAPDAGLLTTLRRAIQAKKIVAIYDAVPGCAQRLNDAIRSDRPFGRRYKYLAAPYLASAHTFTHLMALALEASKLIGIGTDAELARVMSALFRREDHPLDLGNGRFVSDRSATEAEIARFSVIFNDKLRRRAETYGWLSANGDGSKLEPGQAGYTSLHVSPALGPRGRVTASYQPIFGASSSGPTH